MALSNRKEKEREKREKNNLVCPTLSILLVQMSGVTRAPPKKVQALTDLLNKLPASGTQELRRAVSCGLFPICAAGGGPGAGALP